jgi:tRNA (uracil-5-)-methyltransferase TRM9
VRVRSQHGVWERIAHSFDMSRQRTWPHVERFLAQLRPESRVLDLMAGNGRHTASILKADHEAAWVDWSRPAAAIAAERYPDALVVVGDATHLPFPDDWFDACIFVAGLHSLPTAKQREASLLELHRVLRPGGVAQVTVWSRDAPKFRKEGVPGKPVDVKIPWRSHGHDEDRRYHLYTRDALRSKVMQAGFEVERGAAVAIVAKEPDNLVVEVRKPD